MSEKASGSTAADLDDDDDEDFIHPQDAEMMRVCEGMPGMHAVKKDDLMQWDPDMPREDLQQVEVQRGMMEKSRKKWSPEERLAKSEQIKNQANVHFGNGKWRVAIGGYVAAIFYLKHGDPRCPLIIGSEHRGLNEVADALGSGIVSGDEATSTTKELDGTQDLRVVCHVNLAAAALKLQEWHIARAACEWVLNNVDATHSKALFRLAKAQEGVCQIVAAISTVAKLLKHDPSNSEARKLHDDLKKHQAEAKAAFKDMFERARDEGGGEGLYTATEEMHDELKKMKVKAEEPNSGTYNVCNTAEMGSMGEAELAKLSAQMNAALDG